MTELEYLPSIQVDYTSQSAAAGVAMPDNAMMTSIQWRLSDISM